MFLIKCVLKLRRCILIGRGVGDWYVFWLWSTSVLFEHGADSALWMHLRGAQLQLHSY